jgi:hypothetical protein
MGWRGLARSLIASARRAERAQMAAQRSAERRSLARRRELLAQQTTIDRMQAHERAVHEVELYQNYVEVLVSVHKECLSHIEWNRLAHDPPPAPPTRSDQHEQAARTAAASFKPSLGDRLLNRGASKREHLQTEVERAFAADQAEYDAALAQHQSAAAYWQWMRNVAHGVLAKDVNAYRAVLDYLAPFEELQELGSTVAIDDATPDVVAALCTVRDAEIVPSEQRTLSAAGKLVVKPLPVSRYWEIYQDHVCGCAVRVARELMALVPVPRAVVNVAAPMLDTSTGNIVPTTILAVSFQRDGLDRVNFDAADPTDVLKNFCIRSARRVPMRGRRRPVSRPRCRG